MSIALSVAGGILLLIAGLWLYRATVDWLDERTSQITDQEARRRARLTRSGEWPPPPP